MTNRYAQIGRQKLRSAAPEERTDAGIGRGALGNKLAVSEWGQRNPTVITLYELARALSVSPIDLLRSDGNTEW